jgi:hypothetical protein
LTDQPPDFTGVKPDDLYDGPKPKVVPLFADQQPPEPIDRTGVLKIIFEILSTRVLGLVATIAACVIWGFAVYQPDTSRSLAALGFSVTVLGPICALYWRRHPPEV